MAAPKGNNNNPKGRGKGTKNKRTNTWEAFADYCLNGGLERYQRELDSLKGKAFVDAFTTLLEFHKPKLSRAETKHSGSITMNPPIINVKPKGN